jgi:copper chaperone
METVIKVDHLKCGGCANTITKSLLLIPDIYKVDVYPDKEQVVIGHDNDEGLNAAKMELRKLGYPESGTTEGIEKITTNIKSYVSCAVGKLTDKK